MLNEKKLRLLSVKHTGELNLEFEYNVKGSELSDFLSHYVTEPLLDEEDYISYLILDFKLRNSVLFIDLILSYSDNKEETLSIEPDATDCSQILNALSNMRDEKSKKAYGLLIEALYCNCKTCTNKCIHRYKQRRLPVEVSGLGLCKFLL